MNSTIGDSAANSYVSVAYADTFFASSVANSAWPTDTPKKEAALIESTRVLDSQFDWLGFIATSTQALRWPRTDAYDMDDREYASNIIPKILMDAVCNYAYFLLQNGGLNQTQSPVKEVKIGSIDLKFQEDESVIGVPSYIIKSLQSLGPYQGAMQGSAYSVEAMRS
jgi:hypothetical protein